MKDNLHMPEPRARKKPFILFRLIQWAIVALFTLSTITLAAEIGKLSLPGAPITLFWLTLAAMICLAILHVPILFFRLPARAKLAAYVGIIIVLAMGGNCLNLVMDAYHRTPEGAKEAATEAAQQRQQAAIDAANAKKNAADRAQSEESARMLAEMEATKKQLLDMQAKLEACFTTFGHRLPALEEPVKASLHNPNAFEHVSTTLMVPDAQHDNVVFPVSTNGTDLRL